MSTGISSEQIQAWLDSETPEHAKDYKIAFQCGVLQAVLWHLVNDLATVEHYQTRILAAQMKPTMEQMSEAKSI